jgi:hypothetical protein
MSNTYFDLLAHTRLSFAISRSLVLYLLLRITIGLTSNCILQEFHGPELPVELIFEVIEMSSDRDTQDSMLYVIQFRGALRLICRGINSLISSIPAFWDGIIISPRIPVPLLEDWLNLSNGLPMWVSFNATYHTPHQLFTYDHQPCSLLEHVTDSASLFSGFISQCSSLSVIADTPVLLEEIFDALMYSQAPNLRVLETTFYLENYEDAFPSILEHFEFLSLLPFVLRMSDFKGWIIYSWMRFQWYLATISR